MSKKQYEVSRDAVTGLQTQIATMQTALESAVLETERVTTAAGVLMADGKDTTALESELAALATRQRTTQAALAVLESRLEQAKAAQRSAVCAELRAQAEQAESELKARAARVSAAVTELRAALGLAISPIGICNLTWGDCEYGHLLQRPDMLRGAAVFVEQNRPCMTDPDTGMALDRGLW